MCSVSFISILYENRARFVPWNLTWGALMHYQGSRYMWSQNYTPVAGSLGLSSLAAAIPIFVLLFLLGVKRKPAWVAALSGLAAAAAVAIFVYGMPIDKLLSA